MRKANGQQTTDDGRQVMAKSSHFLWQGELKSISSYKWTIYYLDMNNFKLMYIVKVMVFKTTFHNSSVTSLRSTLFVEEITVTGGTSSSKALFSGFLPDGRIDISTICAFVPSFLKLVVLLV